VLNVMLEDGLVAIEVVGAVEFVVKVAEDCIVEGYSAALEAIGFDVAADWDLHFLAPYPRAPWWGWWVQHEWMQILSEMAVAKYMHPCGLESNIRKQIGSRFEVRGAIPPCATAVLISTFCFFCFRLAGLNGKARRVAPGHLLFTFYLNCIRLTVTTRHTLFRCGS
jgi:hypothetical protein